MDFEHKPLNKKKVFLFFPLLKNRIKENYKIQNKIPRSNKKLIKKTQRKIKSSKLNSEKKKTNIKKKQTKTIHKSWLKNNNFRTRTITIEQTQRIEQPPSADQNSPSDSLQV